MPLTVTIATAFGTNAANSPKPNANLPPAPQNCQTLARMSSANQAMTFKNEVVSDADIDRYNLPFPKGGGRWWTRDAERDYYLWGGLTGNPAYDDMQEGRFYLYYDGVVFWFRIVPGKVSESLYDNPYIIEWNSIARMEPQISNPEKRAQILSILKQALAAYGFEGQDDDWVKQTQIIFGF